MSQWQNNQGNWNVSPQAYQAYKAKKRAKRLGRHGGGPEAVQQRSLLVRLLVAPFRLVFQIIKLAIALGIVALGVLVAVQVLSQSGG